MVKVQPVGLMDRYSDCMTFAQLRHLNTRMFDKPSKCAAIQRGLNRLQEWVDRNFTKFTEEKCLGRNHTMYQ